MHLGWYHTGSGSPREVAHIFGAVKYAPDGKTLVFCSNQPTIGSSVLAFDRLAELRDAKQAEITKSFPLSSAKVATRNAKRHRGWSARRGRRAHFSFTPSMCKAAEPNRFREPIRIGWLRSYGSSGLEFGVQYIG